MNEKTKKSLIRLVVSLCLGLVVCAYALLYTYAWFTINSKDVVANGMSMKTVNQEIDTSYYIELNEQGIPEEFLDDFTSGISIPGTSSIFGVRVRNSFESHNSLVLTSIGFVTPKIGVDEIPNEKGKYFGTQLSVEVVSVKINGSNNSTTIPLTSPYEPVSLLPVDASGVPQPNRIVFDINSSFYGSDSARLDYGDSIDLIIRVTFVNKDEAQDDYQNFGKLKDDGTPDGVCQREIFILFNTVS